MSASKSSKQRLFGYMKDGMKMSSGIQIVHKLTLKHGVSHA